MTEAEWLEEAQVRWARGSKCTDLRQEQRKTGRNSGGKEDGAGSGGWPQVRKERSSESRQVSAE